MPASTAPPAGPDTQAHLLPAPPTAVATAETPAANDPPSPETATAKTVYSSLEAARAATHGACLTAWPGDEPYRAPRQDSDGPGYPYSRSPGPSASPTLQTQAEAPASLAV